MSRIHPHRSADGIDRRLSVAPMMACTDRHARYFLRLLSRRTLLYTEMITSAALVHGDAHRHLAHDRAEHPLAAQIGGCEPRAMAHAARLVEAYGYDEVNINCGCPSDRVQSGRFGAALMAEPGRVADCVAAMRAAVRIPVTVKTRIGIDDLDDEAHLHGFVAQVAAAGCETFIVHARKAWLQGLSPKENRELPPLRYPVVQRLAAAFPHLNIVINGGVDGLAAVTGHLRQLDGVMIGRAAYANPYLLADADARVFGDDRPAPDRHAVVRAMLPYVDARLAEGTRLAAIARHMLGLFQGQPGARRWRRHLSEHMHARGAGPGVLEAALQAVAGATRAHAA